MSTVLPQGWGHNRSPPGPCVVPAGLGSPRGMLHGVVSHGLRHPQLRATTSTCWARCGNRGGTS